MMPKEDINFAVREARAMSLSEEQSIKFVMRMAGVSRTVAKQAIQNFNHSVMYSH